MTGGATVTMRIYLKRTEITMVRNDSRRAICATILSQLLQVMRGLSSQLFYLLSDETTAVF